MTYTPNTLEQAISACPPDKPGQCGILRGKDARGQAVEVWLSKGEMCVKRKGVIRYMSEREACDYLNAFEFREEDL